MFRQCKNKKCQERSRGFGHYCAGEVCVRKQSRVIRRKGSGRVLVQSTNLKMAAELWDADQDDEPVDPKEVNFRRSAKEVNRQAKNFGFERF